MTINLDPSFTPLGPDSIKFESFLFSGGEPHIKISPLSDSAITLTHRINSFNDLGLVLVTVDALRRMGVKTIDLFIPYFPGARQDRVMVPGEPLTAKVYADLLNQLNLNKIMIYDVHSDVVPALLNNVERVDNHNFVEKVVAELQAKPLLISPDGGALKKVYGLSEKTGLSVIECAKHRNVETRQLSDFKVYTDDLNGQDCLIVDDICDGGRTFTGLAKELKKKNAGKIYLAISHGIFSHGIEELCSVFDHLFTTDSIRAVSHSKLTQLNIGKDFNI